jgi:2-keto-4-pentenoate hydratase/2-oxohepta-3-ene-1,7-dioic acid hydratase in catechol pathway
MTLKLVNFVPRNWTEAIPRAGALLEDRIVDIAEVCEAADVECGCAGAVVDLLSCADCLQMVREALAKAGPDAPGLPLAEAKLLSPVLRPGKVLCLAGNYAAHRAEGGRAQADSDARKRTPQVCLKPTPNTSCGTGDPILIGRTANFVDYEGELAIIIGKRGKYIKEEDALDYVGGLTCFNDVSERQARVRENPDEKSWDNFFDWLNGKWYDSFAPMGPCAVPLGDTPGWDKLRLLTRVNGETVQETLTGEMTFSIPRQIEFISQMITLEPGDIIATGTPAGVGKIRGVALKPGDVVDVEIEGIGTLSNPVVAESGWGA